MSAYHWAPVPAFLSTDPASVLGTLAAANTFPLHQQQRDAWGEQIEILKGALSGVYDRTYDYLTGLGLPEA